MYIAIINWSAGENDPFTFFSTAMGDMFKSLGREVIYLKLDDSFATQLDELRSLNIDFALTWQGLGSQLIEAKSGKNLWDSLRIPLFTMHGDHPSLMMENHKADHHYVAHHYAVSSFNHYANRYIPRKRPGLLIQSPLFFPDASHLPIEGDFFVMPKNHDDTQSLREYYASTQNESIRNFLLVCADLIDESLHRNRQTDHHSIIDEVLYEGTLLGHLLEGLGDDATTIIHHLHSVLEKFYRNRLAEIALQEMKDFPMRIYGRGWERFHGHSPKHEFLKFDKVESGDFQYCSRYGVVDVCPAYDSLHDRTQRALSSRRSVLIGSSWPLADNFPAARDHIFYCGQKDDLRSKAEAVINNPKEHQERCAEFAGQYRIWASSFQFLRHFEVLSMMMRQQESA